MIIPRKLILAGAAIAVASALGACGEREQVVVYKQGKYQGKPDTKPWENAPGSSLYTTSQWDQGNKTSWEAAVKTRNLAQNEYNRVE